jgi:hypothetical protein
MTTLILALVHILLELPHVGFENRSYTAFFYTRHLSFGINVCSAICIVIYLKDDETGAKGKGVVLCTIEILFVLNKNKRKFICTIIFF